MDTCRVSVSLSGGWCNIIVDPSTLSVYAKERKTRLRLVVNFTLVDLSSKNENDFKMYRKVCKSLKVTARPFWLGWARFLEDLVGTAIGWHGMQMLSRGHLVFFLLASQACFGCLFAFSFFFNSKSRFGTAREWNLACERKLMFIFAIIRSRLWQILWERAVARIDNFVVLSHLVTGGERLSMYTQKSALNLSVYLDIPQLSCAALRDKNQFFLSKTRKPSISVSLQSLDRGTIHKPGGSPRPSNG